jgi:hypothetical protein
MIQHELHVFTASGQLGGNVQLPAEKT